jgi:hypothetical protein
VPRLVSVTPVAAGVPFILTVGFVPETSARAPGYQEAQANKEQAEQQAQAAGEGTLNKGEDVIRHKGELLPYP